MRFFSTAARSGRVRLCAWLAAFAATLVFGIVVLRVGPVASSIVVGALWGLFAAKLVVELARRRHDAGRGARPVVGVAVALLLCAAGGIWAALLLGTSIPLLAALSVLLVLAAFTTVPPGSPDANRWGAPTSDPLRPSFGAGSVRAGATLAVALTLLGAASGHAGMRWIEELSQARDRSMRAAAEPPIVDSGAGPPLENLEALYELQQHRETKP